MREGLLAGVRICTLVCVASSFAFAQHAEVPASLAVAPVGRPQDESLVTLELGAASNWNTAGGAATFAPSLAAESTVKEDWLEIEAGVASFYTRRSTEWDTDFLFKKPWTISRHVEWMLGMGPEWARIKQGGRWSNSLEAELAADFMFWPSGRHRWGWYLEPAYDHSLTGIHQVSLGVSAGLLIGIGQTRR